MGIITGFAALATVFLFAARRMHAEVPMMTQPLPNLVNELG
jgi:hypothetical protein